MRVFIPLREIRPDNRLGIVKEWEKPKWIWDLRLLEHVKYFGSRTIIFSYMGTLILTFKKKGIHPCEKGWVVSFLYYR